MSASLQLPPPPSLGALVKAGAFALFCDFDGTLVELAPTPDSIEPRADMLTKLNALNQRIDGRLALVSGRSVGDVEKHLGPIPLTIAGSHGADKRLANGQILGVKPKAVSDELLQAMRAFATEHGAALEEKPHGLALHYRAKPELEEAVIRFTENMSQRYGLSPKRGKCVVELVEPGADKGAAVEAFMAEAPFAGATPWFIGDDVTDEDGFRACLARGGGAILVGERDNSCANYALPGVAAVHDWLEFE